MEAMDAMNDDRVKIESVLDENDRNEYLKEVRLTLRTPELISCCKQEMYDYSDKEIYDIISNNERYFDPKLFIHLLEIKYNCNIFIFLNNILAFLINYIKFI